MVFYFLVIEMSIYIHIPFCKSICTYCDFCKIYYDKKYIYKYLDSLKNEIESRYKGEVVSSIYIGGGTPTSLDNEELRKLLEIVMVFNRCDDIEFTIEGNIESITESKLKIMREYGVNRISIGVQSFNEGIIKILGRCHTRDGVFEKINLVKKYFDNINIDVIYAVTDDISIVKSDIDCFLKLGIPHISTYSLIIEDNTILKIKGYGSISEDLDYEMYNYIEKALEENGYIHYEVSNYAKKGYESRHNLVYWNNDYYYGFGLGSTGFVGNRRRVNTRNLTKYLDGNYLDKEVYEDKKTRMENEVILGLRKLGGINLDIFRYKYGCDLESVFDIDGLVREGYLKYNGNYLKIDKKYIYISNSILLKIFD